MKNNVETYDTTNKSGTKVTIKVPARIKPIGDGYKILASNQSVQDIFEDPKYLELFIKGISSRALRNDELGRTYGFTITEIGHHLTLTKDAGTGTGAIDYN